MPELEGIRCLGAHLVLDAHLPGAVVEIHQPVHHRRRRARGGGDARSGDHAALQTTRVNRGRLPLPGDAPGQCLGLGEAGRSQRQFGAAAEAGGLDAFDMAVPGEKEAHAISLPGAGWRGEPYRPHLTLRSIARRCVSPRFARLLSDCV